VREGKIVTQSSAGAGVVLIAEDYPDISQLVGDVLRDEGYSVVVVDRGSDVMPTTLKICPGLILLDLSLPDLPGNEVLQQLSQNPQTRETPVVIVSAYSDQLRRVPQVKSIVTKPFDLTTLLDAVRDAKTSRRISA
jgi:DNA-binding response OmpR family regulator